MLSSQLSRASSGTNNSSLLVLGQCLPGGPPDLQTKKRMFWHVAFDSCFFPSFQSSCVNCQQSANFQWHQQFVALGSFLSPLCHLSLSKKPFSTCQLSTWLSDQSYCTRLPVVASQRPPSVRHQSAEAAAAE